MSPPLRFIRKPYQGDKRKLVISIDVGTTYSGVSYAVLDPGQPSQIQSVTQYPGQDHIGGDSKIQSVVMYDRDDKVVAVGAETDKQVFPELGEIEGLQTAAWFKLHFRPPHLEREHQSEVGNLPPLPKNKTAIQVFADMLAYLFKSTKQYICERQGEPLWNSLESSIDFVLSHPNGWEGKQQAEMRHAAVVAGLVPNEYEGQKRISFVTEGEASLHFCLNKIPDALNDHAKDGIMVVDCGGGTLDFSSYTRASDSFEFKEISPPECTFQGSVFVTHRAGAFLAKALQGSKYGMKDSQDPNNSEYIDEMVNIFEKNTKPSFRSVSKTYWIKFGHASDNDPKYGIRSGVIKIDGKEIAKLFQPAVESIIKVVEDKVKKSTIPIKVLFMVGGFATSDYLFQTLVNYFKKTGITIMRPDAYLNKAVAEGAVAHYLDRTVRSRVSKYDFGISMSETFNPNRPEHIARQDRAVYVASGDRWIGGAFSTILPKNTTVAEEKEYRQYYYQVMKDNKVEESWKESRTIMCYRGLEDHPPEWMDQAPDLFIQLCTVSADLTNIARSAKSAVSQHGKKYYWVGYEIALLFGLTELRAEIVWKEDGIEKRGPAIVAYDFKKDDK
ncbi:hypothetical protein AMATHDRAFT_6473 [Amanita thiersii Skay4041]|uniref:Uncharacterized protein n=1 Tax=Amanita thiersii Skay4041 TaxID=703135 RepID=A0A2A9NIZ6_9AGAR|nr:hypothetical protein AMATHDRAFT_6473 [Amanita thiersii Skay4041]